MSFALSRDDQGAPLVTLRGDLDMASTEELDAAVEPIVAQSPLVRLITAAVSLEAFGTWPPEADGT